MGVISFTKLFFDYFTLTDDCFIVLVERQVNFLFNMQKSVLLVCILHFNPCGNTCKHFFNIVTVLLVVFNLHNLTRQVHVYNADYFCTGFMFLNPIECSWMSCEIYKVMEYSLGNYLHLKICGNFILQFKILYLVEVLL